MKFNQNQKSQKNKQQKVYKEKKVKDTSGNIEKEEGISVEAVVVESLRNAMFKLELENKNIVTGYLGGRIKRNLIKILVGDKVTVELSAYDTSKGRIVFRHPR